MIDLKREQKKSRDWYISIDRKVDNSKIQLREEIEDVEMRMQTLLKNHIDSLKDVTETKIEAIEDRLNNSFTNAISTNAKIIELNNNEIKKLSKVQQENEGRIKTLEDIQLLSDTPKQFETTHSCPLRFNSRTPSFLRVIHL